MSGRIKIHEFYRKFQNRAERFQLKIVFRFFEEDYNFINPEMKFFFKIGERWNRKKKAMRENFDLTFSKNML